MEHHIYECKDGRMRAYDPQTQKVVSYPRILMEEKLGRPLDPLEQVHHKDGNPLNNELSNLEVRVRGEHQREHTAKYQDKMETCQFCGKTFLWLAKSQKNFYSNQRRGRTKHEHPFCSKRCIGLYGQQEQALRKKRTECE